MRESLRKLARALLSLWVLVLVEPTLSVGEVQVIPESDELIVNPTRVGIQFNPVVARLSPGAMVAAWSGHYALDKTNTLIFAGRADLPWEGTAEAVLSTRYRSSNHIFPVMARGRQGFLVVWENADPDDGSDHGIFARMLNLDLTPSDISEFPVNTFTDQAQRSPHVAADGDGYFLVVWNDSGDWLEPRSNIMARRYSSDLTAVGPEHTIAHTDEGFPFAPRIAGFRDGGFVITWSAKGTTSGDENVYFKLFDRNGNSGPTQRATRSTLYDQRYSDVATCSDGRFVLVWLGTRRDPDGGIFARWFDRNGQGIGRPIHVNAYRRGVQSSATLSILPSCRAVIVWASAEQDGDGDGAFGRVVAPDGALLSDEFRLNSTTKGQQAATYDRDLGVAADSEDRFFAVWVQRDVSIGQHGDIAGRWFCLLDDDDAPSCGNATCVGDRPGGNEIRTNDALAILRAGVALVACASCRCDTDGSAGVTAVDALLALRLASGLPTQLNCPAC